MKKITVSLNGKKYSLKESEPVIGNKRFGKKRALGCKCTDSFTCKACLDAAGPTIQNGSPKKESAVKQYIAQGLKIAIDAVESQLNRNRDKKVQQFGKDLIAHFRIEQSRYIHEETLNEYMIDLGKYTKIGLAFHENVISARRVVRRALKMIIDEYKRNTKNGEAFATLAQAIMDLEKIIRTLDKLEQDPVEDIPPNHHEDDDMDLMGV